MVPGRGGANRATRGGWGLIGGVVLGSGKGESREVEGGRETEVLLCCLVFHLLEIEKGAIVKIFNYID